MNVYIHQHGHYDSQYGCILVKLVGPTMTDLHNSVPINGVYLSCGEINGCIVQPTQYLLSIATVHQPWFIQLERFKPSSHKKLFWANHLYGYLMISRVSCNKIGTHGSQAFLDLFQNHALYVLQITIFFYTK